MCFFCKMNLKWVNQQEDIHVPVLKTEAETKADVLWNIRVLKVPIQRKSL